MWSIMHLGKKCEQYMDFPHHLADLFFVYVFPKMRWTDHSSVRMVSKTEKLRYFGEECLGKCCILGFSPRHL